MLKGQLTYDRKNRNWNFTQDQNLTKAICGEIFKIQSRNSYYRARAGSTVCPFFKAEELGDIIEWVEHKAHN